MRYFLTLLVLYITIFSSCKKNTDSNSLMDVDNYSKQIEFIPLYVLGNMAKLSFKTPDKPTDIITTLQIKKEKDSTWENIATPDKNNIFIDSLLPQTWYFVRIKCNKGIEESISKIDSFKTKDFYINYDHFFNSINSNNYHKNYILALENEVFQIRGGGFLNVPEIVLHISSISGSSINYNFSTNIINDSLITFVIPKILSDTSFQENNFYDIQLGTLPLISYESFKNQQYNTKAEFLIANKNVHINSIQIENGACKYVHVNGYFGPSTKSITFPKAIGNLSTYIVERKIIIENIAGTVTELLVSNSGNVLCDAPAIGSPDFGQTHAVLPKYHELLQINFRTSLPSGFYTVKVKNIFEDGSSQVSNSISMNL